VIEERAPPLPRWIARELPWRRRVVRVGAGRIHLVDEGEGVAVLLVHGNPTWSFLWRKVVARLAPRGGLRLVVPDLLGFGLSDKPRAPADHTFALHVGAIAELTEALGLDHAIVVGQDWGGPIGVGAAMERGEAFVRGLVLANTAVLEPARPFRPKAFHRFSHLPIVSDVAFRGLLFPVPVMHTTQGDRASIGLRERAAYAWPLRRLRDRAGPLGLARMVPDREDHPTVPLADRLGRFVRGYEGPAALVWGERDPILGRALARHREALPRASVEVTRAGHFLQEEVPDGIAAAVVRVAGL
jgi:haloalkane dehalogenase